MAEATPATPPVDDATIIRQGVTAAIKQTLEPAATQRAYPGHFTIVADGHWFGLEATWPGLDSWQMAGAYLLLGKTQLVRDYFDYVQASQRADGNIPYAIIPADAPPEHATTYNKGMRYPEDVFTFDPKRPGYTARKWIGSCSHWIAMINPLGTLAAESAVVGIQQRLGYLAPAAGTYYIEVKATEPSRKRTVYELSVTTLPAAKAKPT